jgi:flagellin
MAISLLNNISALQAENELQQTANNLQSTLFQLSSGSRLNSGADDPAGLEIANGLQANITALNQSATNANEGVGLAQTADGALAQVTTLLNRATTLATEAANGTNSSTQLTALNTEYQSIQAEITQIGTNTNYNGTAVFGSSTTSIFLSDGTTSGYIAIAAGALAASGVNSLGLTSGGFTTQDAASTELTKITSAVEAVAASRASLGASINRLNAAQGVETAQVQNLTSAEDGITAANIPQEVANLSKYSVLDQTGISALTQANTQLQNILGLFR